MNATRKRKVIRGTERREMLQQLESASEDLAVAQEEVRDLKNQIESLKEQLAEEENDSDA